MSMKLMWLIIVGPPCLENVDVLEVRCKSLSFFVLVGWLI